MLSFIPATNDQQFEALLELIYNQRSTYLEPVLDLIELTWEQFGHYFRHTGTAYGIYQSGTLLGLCWVSLKGNTLSLLGIIIQPKFQGQGIGTQALQWLEQSYRDQVEAIELDVHAGNPRAKSLYQRMGYYEIAFAPGSGFYRMRKYLHNHPSLRRKRLAKARLHAKSHPTAPAASHAKRTPLRP